MDARGRVSRDAAAPRGQHFLGRRLAAELVADAGIAPTELVLEIGAGTGRLTRELELVAGVVVAVELDPRLAHRLQRRFAASPVVRVVLGDAVTHPLPREPFRVVGNIPFGSTTVLLRRLLDDPRRPLTRADLVVQWAVARKRTASPPRNLLSLAWGPWWTFAIARRIPAHRFHPVPRADAGVIVIRRRLDPLLPAADRAAYVRLLRWAFARAGEPLGSALRGAVSPRRVRSFVGGEGLAREARPVDLTVEQWVRLFLASK